MKIGRGKALGMVLSLVVLASLVLADSAFAASPFVSISPSVNFVRIKSSGFTYSDADDNESSVTPAQSHWKTAPGIGITAGIITGSNWQLGLGYEFVGRLKDKIGGTENYNNGALDGYEDLEAKFDLHNIHLQARYNFLPADSQLNFFAYGKAGVTVARAKLSATGYNPDWTPTGEYLPPTHKTKTLFSYGLGAGASYCFTPKLSGELSGEFFQTSRGRFDNESNFKASALGFKIGVGLTLKF